MKRNIIGLLLALMFAIAPLSILIQTMPAYAADVQLIGASSAGTFNTGPTIWYQKFTASVTGNITTIKTHGSGSGNVKVGIYSDTAGKPGTLLAANNTGTAVTGGSWKSSTLSSSYYVVSGTAYWLAVLASTPAACEYSSSSGQYLYTEYGDYATTNLPATATAISNSTTVIFNLQGWGSTAFLSVATYAVTNNGYVAPNYTAMLNGGITDIGVFTPNYRGFVWSTSTHGDPGNVAPVASAYSDNWTETGSFIAEAFSHQVTSFSGATTYYVRSVAHNSIEWAYGSEVSFTTLSAPTITTQAASMVSFTTARLNASVTSDGGQLADVRFAYDNVTRANFALYANTTAWVTDNFTDGDHPYADITGLTGATTYYFRVQIRNDIASAEGSELTFTTANAVLAPTSFTAITNATTTSLSWVKGSGANMTLIRYKPGSYPTSNSDGTLGYLGTGQSQSITGLTPGTTYYFVAYGFTSPTYSSSTAQTMGTTTAFDSTPSSTPALVTPQADSTWTQTPSTTKTATIPIAGGLIQGIADSYNQPLNMVWYFAWMLLAVGVGIGVYIKGNFNIILGVGSMLGVIGVGVWWYNIVAGGIVILLGIIAIGWSLVGLRRPGG